MGERIGSDQIRQLVNNIVDEAFVHDKDNNGLNIKEFHKMVQSSHDAHANG